MNEIHEKALWVAINIKGRDLQSLMTPRKCIAVMLELKLIKHEKQALATLDKWWGEGCYEYGVCLDLGWPVPGTAPKRFTVKKKEVTNDPPTTT